MYGFLLPPRGYRPRDDATYFPTPWLLSTRGCGVLIDNDETNRHRLGSSHRGAWSWGSDIGGFFSLGFRRLTPELLVRWIELGAVSGVMPTKAGGAPSDPTPAPRPQISIFWLTNDSFAVRPWRRSTPRCTQLRFSLSEAATVIVTLRLVLPGGRTRAAG